MSDYIIETKNITKKFGKVKAVDGVNIHVKQGEIYGLIGRNGAGKTTLLKMLCGLAAPTEGSYAIFGREGSALGSMIGRIGLLIEEPALDGGLSAYDNMMMKYLVMGLRQEGVIEEILQFVGLGSVGKKKVKKFSLGMKQRLGIGMALLGEPDILILDEPINGLDPQGIYEIRTLLEKLNKEKNITIIISSHILEELSKVATLYGIIDEGRLLKELTRKDLEENCRRSIELKVDKPEKACIVLESMGIKDYKVVDVDVIRIFERVDEGGKIAATLDKEGIKTIGISVRSEDIEEYFLELTGKGGGANA